MDIDIQHRTATRVTPLYGVRCDRRQSLTMAFEKMGRTTVRDQLNPQPFTPSESFRVRIEPRFGKLSTGGKRADYTEAC